MDEPQAIKFSYTDSTQNTSLSPLSLLYYFNYYHLPPCYFFIILQSLLLPSSITLLQLHSAWSRRCHISLVLTWCLFLSLPLPSLAFTISGLYITISRY